MDLINWEIFNLSKRMYLPKYNFLHSLDTVCLCSRLIKWYHSFLRSCCLRKLSLLSRPLLLEYGTDKHIPLFGVSVLDALRLLGVRDLSSELFSLRPLFFPLTERRKGTYRLDAFYLGALYFILLAMGPTKLQNNVF